MAMTTGSKVLHGSVLLVGALSVVIFFVLVPGSGDDGSGYKEPNQRSSSELRPVKSPTAGVSQWASGPKGSGGGGGRGRGGGGGGGQDPCDEDIGSVVRQNGGFSMFKGFSANNSGRPANCDFEAKQNGDIDAWLDERGRR